MDVIVLNAVLRLFHRLPFAFSEVNTVLPFRGRENCLEIFAISILIKSHGMKKIL